MKAMDDSIVYVKHPLYRRLQESRVRSYASALRDMDNALLETGRYWAYAKSISPSRWHFMSP